jgi:hypothetical protein
MRRPSKTEPTLVLYARIGTKHARTMQWPKIFRGALALIVGYAAIVLITSVGFDLVHGKGSLWGSSPLVLFEGTLVAILAGLIGGFTAGWIGAARGVINAALVLIPLTLDTTYVLFFFKGTAPWWFDAIGSGTLMSCTLIGGWLRDYVSRR